MVRIRKNILIPVLAATIGAAGSGIGTYLYLNHGNTLPDFSDKTKKDVEKWISSNSISEDKVEYVYEYTLKEDKDEVLSQSIPSGKHMNDYTLYIILSNGADPYEEVTLPDFSTQNIKDIKKWFSKNKFSNVTYKAAVSDVDDDEFISMNPAAGTAVKRADAIEVQYSMPDKEITVPDLIDYTQDEINAWGTENFITIVYTSQSSDTVGEGAIISVSSESGSTIHTGDTVTVVLSTGKETEEDKDSSSSTNSGTSGSGTSGSGTSGSGTSGNSTKGNGSSSGGNTVSNNGTNSGSNTTTTYTLSYSQSTFAYWTGTKSEIESYVKSYFSSIPNSSSINFSVSSDGNGNRVLSISPASGNTVTSGSEITAYINIDG
jgi:beta-lactam-binding protein with PASTA domain